MVSTFLGIVFFEVAKSVFVKLVLSVEMILVVEVVDDDDVVRVLTLDFMAAGLNTVLVRCPIDVVNTIAFNYKSKTFISNDKISWNKEYK